MTISKEDFQSKIKHSDFVVKRITIDALFELADEWQDLLSRSSVDPIFLGPAWLSSWWDSWGEKQDDIEAIILIVLDASNRLMGIAPLYSSLDRIRGFKKVKRIQFIGSNFRKSGVTRTEYIDFILDQECRDHCLDLLLCHLFDQIQFDEFVIADIRDSSFTNRAIDQFASRPSLHIRRVDHDTGTRLQLEGDFQTYLSKLGKSTRLRIFNRRKILTSLGHIEIIRYESGGIGQGFDNLNQLFEKRWGHPALNDSQLEFQTILVSRLQPHARPQMTGILLDGVCISMLFNIRTENVEYNFLSGFQTDIHPKISLGMLHFGYAIEQAYSDGIREFDFLLGPGKQSNYKRHFGGQTVQAHTVQLVCNPLLGIMYRLNDFLSK